LAEQMQENIIIDDKKLARMCVAGDQGAMKILITKHQDRVYNIIHKICINSDDAAELTQDTFVKVLENIAKFKGQSSLYTWIFRIAVNAALNFRKRQLKVGFESLDKSVDRFDAESRNRFKDYLADKSAADPAVLAEDKELYALAMSSIEQLDDEHRAVIVLRDVEGLSYLEMSEVLEVELGTVKSRLSRAREALRRIVKAMTE